MPVSTLHQWARPNGAEPLVTVFPRAGRSATVPFVGFAEAFVLSALRSAGVPMQRIRPAVAKLSAEIGLEHALVSKRVYTDGGELIFDYAKSSDDEALLTVVRTGQQHFEQIIRNYLKPISYGDDGWAQQVHLPAYRSAQVLVDPNQAFGQPLVIHGGARVEDLVDRFQAGDGSRTSPTTLVCQRPRSRTSSALPSGSPPEFFIDRSLGRHIVPDALRAAGATSPHHGRRLRRANRPRTLRRRMAP